MFWSKCSKCSKCSSQCSTCFNQCFPQEHYYDKTLIYIKRQKCSPCLWAPGDVGDKEGSPKDCRKLLKERKKTPFKSAKKLGKPVHVQIPLQINTTFKNSGKRKIGGRDVAFTGTKERLTQTKKG